MSIAFLGSVQPGAALLNYSFAIHCINVLWIQAQTNQQIQARYSRGAGSGADEFNLTDLLFYYPETVKHRCAGNNGRAMLIVMEHRYFHPLAQFGFDIKALRRLDVLQIDPAKGRLQGCDDVHEFVRIVFGDFNVENVNAGKFLE